MIEVIAEHSVDMSLLPEKANILDAGCRGFEFTNYFRNNGHSVIALDIDPELQGDYLNLALVDNDNEFLGSRQVGVPVKRTHDPNGMHVCSGKVPDFWVSSVGIVELVDKYGFFDVAKLDIEGSEYEVIMSMDRPYAKQLSVEFHLHTGVYDIEAVQKMEIHLWGLGYETVQHERTRRHGLGPNFWDSLFILK